MLRERTEFVRNSLYIADLVLVSIHFFLLYAFMLHYKSFQFIDFIPQVDVVPMPAAPEVYLRAYWLALFIWAVLLKRRGDYHYLRLQTYEKIFIVNVINGFLFFVFFTSLAFVFKFDFLSRFFIMLYTTSAVLLLLANRIVVLSVSHVVRSRGYNVHNILIVGTGRRAQEFLSLAVRHKEWGYKIAGFLDKDPKMIEKGVNEPNPPDVMPVLTPFRKMSMPALSVDHPPVTNAVRGS